MCLPSARSHKGTTLEINNPHLRFQHIIVALGHIDLFCQPAKLLLTSAEEVRKAVGQLTPETVVQRISGITLDVAKVLSGVQQQLVTAVEEFNTTKEGVNLLKEELNELHQKDIAATALDQLVQDYETKAKDLEVEIQTRKLDWEKEQQDRSRIQREFDENLVKSRKRESDDYSYKTAQERKRVEDEFTEQFRLKQHENREKQ